MELKPFAGRREDDRLLTGQGRYTADWNFPGQLYGCFLRSDRAHARIASIDTGAARAAPGVVAVYTGEDVKHFQTPPPMVRYPIKVPQRPILARERVRYVGEEIALVVAASSRRGAGCGREDRYRVRGAAGGGRRLSGARARRAAAAPRRPRQPGRDLRVRRRESGGRCHRARGARHAAQARLDAGFGDADGAEGLRGHLRQRDRQLRRVRLVAGHLDDDAELRRHYRRAGGAHPPARARRRRRLRHPLAGLSRVRGADARGEDARPAGEMDRVALRDHRQRSPWTRGRAARRARARPRRALHRTARALDLQLRRLSFPGRPAHQYGESVDARDQRLPHSRRSSGATSSC